ncbi:MAG: nuclear transport factor 2 family protein [Betaproteobacteria bacterium]
MQHTEIKKGARTADHEILGELNRGYVRSVEERDAAWFDQHLAADFMNSNPDGSLVDRAAFLGQVAGGPGVSGIRAHDVIVRVIGDLAIIHARTSYRTPSGRAGTGRYTDIWSRRAAGWVCVAAQVTRC